MLTPPQTDDLITRLKSFEPDQSFFVADVSQKEVAWLRARCKRAGLNVQIFTVALDEIYQQPGVRIYPRKT